MSDFSEDLCRHHGDAAKRHILSETARESGLLDLSRRETLLDRVDGDDDVVTHLLTSTESAEALLQLLRDPRPTPLARRLLDELPLLSAYGEPTAVQAIDEHDTTEDQRPFPLLDHLADGSLGRKLAGLERGDIDVFQETPSLSKERFSREAALVADLEELDLLPTIRAALLFLDFTKGGTTAQRAKWSSIEGVDLTVHNRAARRVLEHRRTLERFDRLARNDVERRLVLRLVSHHGLTGQAVRGETPLTEFADFVEETNAELSDIASWLSTSKNEAADRIIDLLHVINVCDTAAVREGLLDDRLLDRLIDVESMVRRSLGPRGAPASGAAEELRERQSNELFSGESAHDRLLNRLLRLRKSRIDAGEPRVESVRALAELGPDDAARFERQFERAQLWYCEAASADLTPVGQFKLIALGVRAAAESTEAEETFHVTFEHLMSKLGSQSEPSAPYRVRLLDALLAPVSLTDIVRGETGLDDVTNALGSVRLQFGGQSACSLLLDTTDEADALLTLLPIYERKSSAAFHTTLKTLCDLYGLRKDEFDRLSNEAQYLEHMNSARNDKERMLDYVRPGRVVEVGPGGGVVLDLLEKQFPDAEVIGVDVSRMVVEALRERKRKENRSWTVVEADAFELPDVVGPDTADTVVFCSVLHEIYSYVEYPPGSEEGTRFNLDSVRDILRAAWNALGSGGRIVIRDGVMPPAGERLIRFNTPEGPEFLELFQEEFEGRDVEVEWEDAVTARLSAPDAMEFLYCYTWGPSSFPYEVREQYGVLPYDDYVETILNWLSTGEDSARVVELPPAVASYLQDGYREGLAPLVDLMDGEGQPVSLPDSNCLIVIEKT